MAPADLHDEKSTYCRHPCPLTTNLIACIPCLSAIPSRLLPRTHLAVPDCFAHLHYVQELRAVYFGRPFKPSRIFFCLSISCVTLRDITIIWIISQLSLQTDFLGTSVLSFTVRSRVFGLDYILSRYTHV